MYLTGGVTLENAGQLVAESAFPGRLGRLAFAFLVANRSCPVTRGELADALWGDDPPMTPTPPWPRSSASCVWS